jgi:hypothetical protein
MNKVPANDAGKLHRWRWLTRLTLAGAALIGAAELTLRYLRYDEFPIYDTDAKIGYIPKPNQAGCFLGRYCWTLNERSMLNEPWVPDREHGILVIGDSLVWGEVRMAPRDKLGACLQSVMGGHYRIWSVGAGSWANLNEVEYLKRNEDVIRNIHGLVWIANAGDFSYRSLWASDYTHPRQRPRFLVGYLAGKAAIPWLKHLLPASFQEQEQPVASDAEVSAETARELRAWLKSAPRDLLQHSLFVWYPDAAELKTRNPATSHLLSAVRESVEAEGFRFFDLRGDARWRSDCYRDPIHPSAEGDRVLASVLQAQLWPGDTPAMAP